MFFGISCGTNTDAVTTGERVMAASGYNDSTPPIDAPNCGFVSAIGDRRTRPKFLSLGTELLEPLTNTFLNLANRRNRHRHAEVLLFGFFI